ncbi:MAG TPA: hypothetical protein VKA94_07565, partial [Hyphomicrobiales bacterium]|nr:hypothetical protein [Hyphomicrobiales bacterium]
MFQFICHSAEFIAGVPVPYGDNTTLIPVLNDENLLRSGPTQAFPRTGSGAQLRRFILSAYHKGALAKSR